MRWYWIDRFVEFESGRYAKAVKCISLAEDYLRDHFPGYPVIPKSLVIEGLAQTGGLLVYEHSRFAEKVILAKIPVVRFFCEAFPGDTLIYTATIKYFDKDGAMVAAASHKGRQLQAEIEIVFAHLDGDRQGGTMFESDVFLRMMDVLGAFEVGRAADGSPLSRPSSPLRPAPSTEPNGQ